MFKVICLSGDEAIFESPRQYSSAADAIAAHDTYVSVGRKVFSDKNLDWMVIAA